MKKTKLYAKKSLSLIMAVMMLLTCWVWVAPEHEHASAAATNGKYYVKIIGNNRESGNLSRMEANSMTIYFVKQDGSTGSLSVTPYKSEMEKNGQSNLTFWDGWVDGVPTSVAWYIKLKYKAASSVWFSVGDLKICVADSAANCTADDNIGNIDSFKWQNNAVGQGNKDTTNTWTVKSNTAPVPTTVTTSIASSHTFNMPQTGSVSKDFTLVAKDQYGVEWGAGGITASITETDLYNYINIGVKQGTNDTITVSPITDILGKLSTYSYKTGKATTTLTVKYDKGNVSQTCALTFQSSKYDVEFYNHKDELITTDSYYYGTPFTRPSSGASSSIKYPSEYLTAIDDTPIVDENGAADTNVHQTYKWQQYNPNGNTSNVTEITETGYYYQQIPDQQEAHNMPADYQKTDDAENHSKECSDCGYVATQPHNWGADEYIKKTDSNYKTHHIKQNTCTVCGYVEAQDHEHQINSVFVRTEKQATCTQEGIEIWKDTCSLCGYEAEKELKIDKLPHNYIYKSEYVDKAPTCDADGYSIFRCSACNAQDPSRVETLPASGHAWEKGETVAPTCDADGYTNYTCSNDASHTKQDDIVPKLGHNYEFQKQVKATCFDGGYDLYVCTRDSSHTDKRNLTDKLEHVIAAKDVIIKNETCEEAGLKNIVTYCTLCDTIFYTEENVVINPNGEHKYYAVPAENQPGYHKYQCGCGKFEQVDGKDKIVACSGTATCTTPATCPECGQTYGTTAAHSYTEIAAPEYFASAATCTSPAKYYKSCVWCKKSSEGDTNETFVYGVALPHTYDKQVAVEENLATEATCKTQATYYYTCSCGAKGEETFAAGEFADHSYTREDRKSAYRKAEATCQSPAEYYMSCKWCDESSQGKDNEATFFYGEKVDHIFDNQSVTEDFNKYSDATCTAKAKYYFTCRWHGLKGHEEVMDKNHTFRAGETADHAYAEVRKEIYAVDNQSSTCTEEGTYYKSCTVCGTSAKDDTKLADNEKTFTAAALGHVKMVSRTNILTATCKAPGAYYEITRCGREGCNWTDIAVEKTETADAVTYTFTNGTVLKAVITKANGEISFFDADGNAVDAEDQSIVEFTTTSSQHNYGAWSQTVVPSCLPGTESRTCSDCGKVENRSIPANGEHQFRKETDENGNPTDEDKVYRVEPTCLKAGEEYKICDLCKQKVGTELPALGHEWIEPEAILDENSEVIGYDYHNDMLLTPATCKAEAVYYKHCHREDCGMTMDADGITYVDTWGGKDENGHNFGGDVKFDEEDNPYYECLNGCGATSKLECVFDLEGNPDVEVPGNCRTKGYKEYYCKTCGDKHVHRVETAQDFTNHEGAGTYTENEKAATCVTKGNSGALKCSACHTVISVGVEDIPVDKDNHESMTDYDGQPATCEEAGWEAYRKCAACGFEEIAKVEIPATEHNFGPWAKVDGVDKHTRTCSNPDCEAVETEDCIGDGSNNCVDKAHCTVCGGVCGEVDSTNHKTIVTVDKKPSTCTQAGHESYRVCKACGENGADVLIDEEIIEIAPLGHDFEGAEWTPVEDEAKHERVCVRCNVEKDTEDCIGDGTENCQETANCTKCGQEVGSINPAVHASTETITVGAAEATCRVPGYTGDTFHACCYTEGDDENSASFIKKGEETTKDHNLVLDSTTAATCIAEGAEVYKCTTCPEDNVYTKTETLPINSRNHASNEAVIVGRTESTCTTAGYTGDYYHKCCYDPDKTAAENKKALISKGEPKPTNGTHVYTETVPFYSIEIDADGNPVLRDVADAEGKKEFVPVKGEITYEMKVAARRGDFWYHAKICTGCNEVVIGRCTTKKSTSNCVETDICTTCKGLCSLIEPENHKGELTVQKGTPATCNADGTKDYYKCEHCGKTYFDKAGKNVLNLPADASKLVISHTTINHRIDWNNPDRIEQGNCNTSGKKVFSCSVCGEETEIDTGIVSTKHNWRVDGEGNYLYEVITPATCGRNGYEAIRCNDCNSIKLNSYVTIPSTGEHTYGEEEVIPGENCANPGKIIRYCTKCGHKDEKTDTTGISAHQWTASGEGWLVVGGDCSTGIVYERVCGVCQHSEQYIDTNGSHAYEIYIMVEPTPEVPGYVIYKCRSCGHESEREELIYDGDTDAPEVTPDTDEHRVNPNIYRVVENATCDQAEIREYTCLDCGQKVRYYYGEKDESLHVWKKQPAEMATCEKAGHTEYYRCVRCLEERYKEIEPALGHKDDNGDGKCDNCSGKFYEPDNGGQVTCTCSCHKTGFMGFIYKIMRFFWKIFGTNKSCACGNVHY